MRETKIERKEEDGDRTKEGNKDREIRTETIGKMRTTEIEREVGQESTCKVEQECMTESMSEVT